MKAYMVFDREGGTAEGAVLVFANTAMNAKKMAWKALESWTSAGWIDVRVRWLRDEEVWLAQEEGVDLDSRPCVIESPRSCVRCDLWGRTTLDRNQVCGFCRVEE